MPFHLRIKDATSLLLRLRDQFNLKIYKKLTIDQAKPKYACACRHHSCRHPACRHIACRHPIDFKPTSHTKGPKICQMTKMPSTLLHDQANFKCRHFQTPFRTFSSLPSKFLQKSFLKSLNLRKTLAKLLSKP